MIIWNKITLKKQRMKIINGDDVMCKFTINTWYILFIPIYRNVTMTSTQF